MSIHQSLLLPDMSVLTDKELQKFEKPIAQANTEKDHFIPSLPIKILLEVVRLDAVGALPLVLAIHRQLVMKKKTIQPSMRLSGALPVILALKSANAFCIN